MHGPMGDDVQSAYHGPYPIEEKVGKSCIKIHTGYYANGTKRTEIRHWNSCYPAPPETTETNFKKALGRKPLNPHALPFIANEN